MKLKLSGVAVALAFAISALAAFAAPNAKAAAPSRGSASVLINEATAAGTFTIQRFAVQKGVLTAIGTFTGTTSNGDANATPAYAPVQTGGTALTSAAVTQAAATCPILDLTLGPLHLDLLGLVVDLNQVHLTITAEQGSGNLLGNLLCAVAGLLDNAGGGGGGLGGLLQSIANLLNQILGQLQL